MNLFQKIKAMFSGHKHKTISPSLEYPTPHDLYLKLTGQLLADGKDAWTHFEWQGYENPFVEIAFNNGNEQVLNVGLQGLDALPHLPPVDQNRGITIESLGDGLYRITGLGAAQWAGVIESILNHHRPAAATMVIGWLEEA
ncbi:MAG: hypothetical protein HJJLKODD_00749 [Phycisphaerae bacterium]|nr:hypothetical protein [Phycisphaerae bacterium]